MLKSVLLSITSVYCFAFCAQSATPVILNCTESAGTGDIIYLQGSGFGSTPYVEYSYNDSNWTAFASVTSGQGTVTVKIPGSETRLPDLLTVRVSPDNQTWSAPAYINMPIAMSFDTDQVAPGSSFRIFGRNLFFGRVSTVRFVDTVDGSSQAGTVNTSSSTHYVLSVTAPTNIKANHTYQLFVSNGYSGNAQSPVESLAHETLQGRLGGVDYWKLGLTWAADLSFYANIYNVKSDPRLGEILAAGDGIADDTWPIMHAIQVATAAGGGVVYLPAGNYTLHFSNGCGIPLLYKVVLQGAGAGVTNIKYGYPAGTLGGYAVCFADQSGLVDMTVSNVDVAQQWQWSGNSSGNSEVFLKRVTWNLGTSQWLNFISDDRVAIEDSVINQGTDSAFNFLGPLNMQGCQHCTVADSTINFSVCGLFFDHTNDMVFENNQVIRDISVAPNPISVTHSIAANFVKNFVVLNNTFSSVGDALPTNNDGEVINTEGGGQVRFDEFRGSISSATSTSLTDSSQNFFQSPNHIPYLQAGIATVAIVSGEGLGQTRTVTSVSSDGQTITIDHPWDVQPEDGSHYATFDWSGENWTVVNNTLNRNFKGFEIFSASALNLLFESNVLSDSDGIMVSPTENPQGQFGAIFNVIKNLSIIGNTFRDEAGIRPSYVGLIPREDGQTASFGTHIIGANVKANNVIAFTPNVFNCPMSWDDYKVKVEGYLADYYWQSGSSYDMSAPPPLLGTIFQGNMAWHSNAAFYLNSGTAQTSISGTFAVNAGSMLEDVPLPEVTTGSTGTVLADTLQRFPIGSGASASSDLIHGAASLFGGRSIAMGHQGSPYSLESSSDSLSLFGQQIGTNSEIVAHVTLVADANVTGLLMMRGTSLPNSAFASIGLSTLGIEVQTRGVDGEPAQTSLQPFTGNAAWLKLDKVGDAITALYSADGLDWTPVTNNVAFSTSTYLVGIAEVSDGTQNLVNTTFDGIAFTLTPNGKAPHGIAPLVWQQLTIGSLPANKLTPEPASVTSFTLPTSEYQVGTGPDSLSMLAQKLTGDITAVARITIPSTADSATRGLLAFRANSSPIGPFFAFGQSKDGQMIFQWRAYTGGGIGGYTFPYTTNPVWVKVTKSGNNFTAHFSADGVSWQYGGVVGSTFFGSYDMGLESLSDTLSSPSILFDNVSVTPNAPTALTSAKRHLPNPIDKTSRWIRKCAVAFWRSVRKSVKLLV